MFVGRTNHGSELRGEAVAARFEGGGPQALLESGIEEFDARLAIATSFRIDGMVIIDMAPRISPSVRVITVDSGRLPEETYELMDRVPDRYGLAIEVYSLDSGELQDFVTKASIPSIRSVPLRAQCCQIRKVSPLKIVLRNLDV